MEIVLAALLLRRFRLILEVEEIYQDVVETSMWKRRLEYFLFSRAHAFIFSTKLLDEKLNAREVPSVVVHGAYRTMIETEERSDVRERSVVYAGTLERRKGGAAAAAAAAAYLDATYHLNIAGFGSSDEIRAIANQVAKVNSMGRATVTFHGTLVGEEYSKLLKSCEVGLATQSSSARFSDTSFPSKILSYLAHGLSVVAPRIPAIESSDVASAVSFYDGDEPQAIADAIRESCNSTETSASDLLARLDKGFVQSLGRLLVGVELL